MTADEVVWGGLGYALDTVTIDVVNVADDDLSPLAALVRLETLRVSWTDPHETAVRFPTDLAPLSGLTRLRVLALPGWEISDLAPLAELRALEELDVRDTRVTDLSPLAGLENLRLVLLDRCPVRDLTPLHGLRRLEKVSVRGAGVAKEQVGRLRRAIGDAVVAV